MVCSQLKRCCGSKRTPHDKQGPGVLCCGKPVLYGFKDKMRILQHGRDSRGAGTSAVAPVISSQEIHAVFVIKRADGVIIADNFTVAVKKKNVRIFLGSQMEPGMQLYPFINRYGIINCVRRWHRTLSFRTWMKYCLQYFRQV